MTIQCDSNSTVTNLEIKPYINQRHESLYLVTMDVSLITSVHTNPGHMRSYGYGMKIAIDLAMPLTSQWQVTSGLAICLCYIMPINI